MTSVSNIRQPSMFHLTCVIFFVSVPLFGVSASGSDEAVKAETRIQPELAVQSEIASIAQSTNEQDFGDRLNRLRNLSAGRSGQLISQLLHYAASDRNTKARVVVGRVIEHLHLPKQTIVHSLVPHLDNVDSAIREMTRSLLRDYEDRSAVRPPDFSAYRAFIEAEVRTGKEPQVSLIEFMYESDPGTALLEIMRGYQLRDPNELKSILWTEHVVSNMLWKRRYGFLRADEVDPGAMQQLDFLSRHERWWVRMYVAALYRQYPDLRRASVVERLREDNHALVRKVILATEEKYRDSYQSGERKEVEQGRIND